MSSQNPADVPIPDEFICPITQEVFKDPVMDNMGRTFERNAILEWLSENGTCPMSREPRRAFNYIPNPTMKAKVRVWMKQNDIGDDAVYKPSKAIVLTLKSFDNDSNHTSTSRTDDDTSSVGDEAEEDPIQIRESERRRNRNATRRLLRIFRR